MNDTAIIAIFHGINRQSNHGEEEFKQVEQQVGPSRKLTCKRLTSQFIWCLKGIRYVGLKLYKYVWVKSYAVFASLKPRAGLRYYYLRLNIYFQSKKII